MPDLCHHSPSQATAPHFEVLSKDGPGRFSYETNYLVDDLNGVIVDVEATPARLSQEIVAAKAMLRQQIESRKGLAQ